VKLSLSTSEQSTQPESSAKGDRAAEPKRKVNRINRSVFAVFGSTFLTIFFAEMGDKTQLTTLLMTAESSSPWIVFAGAGSALVATSLIGVAVGRWLASRVSETTIETGAGAILLLISVLLLWDLVQL
jgi:putative Ca2+/H+ antiporter (TMEM165/GDT1 family)